MNGGGLPLLSPKPLRSCGGAVVCVPARNEALKLPKLVAALGRQARCGPGRLRVLLLINNTTDDSRRAAEHAAEKAQTLDLRVIERSFAAGDAHAGSARRAAMEGGAEWLESEGAADGVLLTTDADAMPDDQWVTASCRALAAGADIVGAAITGDPKEEARFSPRFAAEIAQVLAARTLARDLEDMIDPVAGDPGPRHTDHTGGGLALRLATYRAVGGCPALPFREDLGLVDAVRRMGGVVRHDPSVRVTVSARMRGRAAGGMASTISAWSRRVARGEALLAPDPDEQMAHWCARAAARAAAIGRTAHLSEALAARAVAAEIALRCPDPVDWRGEVPARAAISLLEHYLDEQIRPPRAVQSCAR